MPKLIDLTGEKFGRLVVVKRVENGKWGHIRYLCLCDCGKEKIVLSNHLKSGDTKSCGCLSRVGNNLRHGHSINRKMSKIYMVWTNMKDRCANPNYHHYKDYGGRGITVCKRWMKFENFLEDIGECPPGLTLERENNNKGYYPDNCRWATKKEQAKNKRNNLYIEYNGRKRLLIEWSEETGIPYMTLWQRIFKYNWSTEKALTTPVKKRGENG